MSGFHCLAHGVRFFDVGDLPDAPRWRCSVCDYNAGLQMRAALTAATHALQAFNALEMRIETHGPTVGELINRAVSEWRADR